MPLFLQQWYAEWVKLLARKRTYIGFAVFLTLEIVLLAVLHLQGVERVFERLISRQGGTFEYYFSALTVAFLVVRLSVFLLGALYLSLVAGDIVAKEGEDGHLRLLLARPISRARFLLVKYLTCTGYAVVLVCFISLSALLMGLALKGWGGGLFAMAPELGLIGLHDGGPGFKRYLAATALLGMAMTAISSVAFFLSCLPIKPAAATIGALSYMLVDMILRESGMMDSYDHLLITRYMMDWVRVIGDPIEWVHVVRSAAVLLAFNLTLLTLGITLFSARDLKS